MMEALLVLIPLLAAVAAVVWPSNHSRPWLLPAGGLPHAVLSLWLLLDPPATPLHPWFGFDPLTRAILPVVSLLFLACAAYGVPYLKLRGERPNRVFVAVLLAGLGLLSAAHMARHLGLLWIATEAVTLASVPLLHFNNTPRAFEATWKYLLVGGTGIALSLLGSFCLGYASAHGGGAGDLTFAGLMAQGPSLSRPWVLIAWVLLLVGYGTKMGLAPMHTWKPDAYGEAPGIVGALLAGGVTSVAFTAVLRVRAVVDAAGEGAVASRTLLAIGLFSTFVAALFLLGTRDFKRMLAYSSVEHMGVLSLGAGLGGLAGLGSMLHMVNHSCAKAMLFLLAGNILAVYRTKSTRHVRGLLKSLPITGPLWMAGFLAIAGSPPFGLFVSELIILKEALQAGRLFVAAGYLLALSVIFVAMARIVLPMVYGETDHTAGLGSGHGRNAWAILPPMVLGAAVLTLGLYLPAWLQQALAGAARAAGIQ